jgi:hypothetical protein
MERGQCEHECHNTQTHVFKFKVLLNLNAFFMTLGFTLDPVSKIHYVHFAGGEKDKLDETARRNLELPFHATLTRLSGSEANKIAMHKVLSFCTKVPKCLMSALTALTEARSGEAYLDILCRELLEFYWFTDQFRLSCEFAKFVYDLLNAFRELYECARFFRLEEFLFVIRNSVLIDSEFFYEFARLYMEVGIDQLASLDLKNEIKDNLTQVLAEYVKRQEETAESPRAQFETALGQVIIVLPDFCM